MIKFNYLGEIDILMDPLPPGNAWRELIVRRELFYKPDDSKVLDESFFNLFTLNGKIITNRKYGITNPERRLEGKVYYWDLPIDPSRHSEKKNNTTPVITEDHLIFDYHCNFQKMLNRKDLSPEEKESLKLRFYNLTKDISMNVLRKAGGEETYVEDVMDSHNDILVNGRKVWAEERTQMYRAVYAVGNTIMNFYNHVEFLNPLLIEERKKGKASGKIMSGIEEEIPGYTKEQYIEDYIKEAHRLISELNVYLE